MARKQKYESLEEYLRSTVTAVSEVTLTLYQIEEIINSRLPRSAYEYREWWSNQTDVSNRPQAKAWIRAGFHVDALNQSREAGWVRWKRIIGNDTVREVVHDSLRPLDEVLKPDTRSETATIYEYGSFRKKTLEDHHAEISSITLNVIVPLSVRQLFETAKNLALYCWFVYRFHQPAELCGFGAVEMALREKAKIEESGWWSQVSQDRVPSMAMLFDKAIRSGWIENQGFSVWWHHQQRAAYDKAMHVLTEKMIREDLKEIETPALEEFKNIVGDENYDYIKILSRTFPSRRNRLAHGSQTLSPTCIGTLELCSEVINNLFPIKS